MPYLYVFSYITIFFKLLFLYLDYTNILIITQVFNVKMKKLLAEREERERDRKKKRKHHAPEDEPPESPEPEVTAPASLTVCNNVHEHMREFKVRGLLHFFTKLYACCIIYH